MPSGDDQLDNNAGHNGNGRSNHKPCGDFAKGNKYRWPPGVSANPAGRPKGVSIEAQLRELLDKDDGKLGKAMAQKAIEMALKGNHKFWQTVVERVYGKVIERLAVEGSEEMMKIVAGIDVKQVCGQAISDRITGNKDNGQGDS